MSTNQEYEQRIAELEKEVKELKERLTVNMKREKYGLNWIDVPEAFDKESENKIPVLEEVKEKSINNDDGKPTHILIEGDNYHALQCLNYTHKGKVDVIYIDPPYNTGSDGFVYKDDRILDKYPNGSVVDANHPLRHSYWLSFMSKRLKLAKNLLSEKGVIFISIDDNEQANLKLLCDSIFGEKNFVAQFIWKKTSNPNSTGNNIGIEHEYVVVYAKSNNYELQGLSLTEEDFEKYTGRDEYFESRGPFKLVGLNKTGTITDLRPNLTYEIEAPDGSIIKPNPRWRWSQEKFFRGVKENRISFKNQKGKWSVFYKQYLNEDTEGNYVKRENLVKTIVDSYGRTTDGTSDLNDVIGKAKFDFPKPIKLINLFVKTVPLKNSFSIILDFFAGSGTTLHATMKLNEEDGGHRQCILVQMNENNICEEVTYERNKRVIQGYKNSKGEQIPGLGNSLKYYKTAFIGKNNAKNATDDDRTELARRAGYLLSLGENMLDEVESNEYFQIFTDKKNATAIYFTDDYEMLDDFIEKMEEISSEYKKIIIYVFSWSTGSEIVNEFAHIRNAEIKPIPTPILEIYKSIYN